MTKRSGQEKVLDKSTCSLHSSVMETLNPWIPVMNLSRFKQILKSAVHLTMQITIT